MISVKRRVKKKQRTVPGKKQVEAGELRQDLITGKWVVVATGRTKKPSDYTSERKKPQETAKYVETCPFCNLSEFRQKPDVLRLPDDPDDWQLHIFPNKYPAFTAKDDFRTWQEGPYRAMEAVGYHEVLAMRHHNQYDAKLSESELALQIEALVLRFRELKEKPSVRYIQIIKNHGEKAGGSLEHPHHQILTIPVLPSDVRDIMEGAKKFRDAKGEDPYAVMLDYELEENRRVVFENDIFAAFCPFASRVAFEVWIMPKKHDPFFENMGPAERVALAEAMRFVLRGMYAGLNDPPYNYYIQTVPCDERAFVSEGGASAYFRWHVEILPRLGIWGGFEMGTGLEITSSLPEESAEFLRDRGVA